MKFNVIGCCNLAKSMLQDFKPGSLLKYTSPKIQRHYSLNPQRNTIGITEKPDPGPVGSDPNGPDPYEYPYISILPDNRLGIFITSFLLFVRIRAP